MQYTTKISKKWQITIPKAVREELGLRIGDIMDVWTEGQTIVMRRRPRLGEETPKPESGDVIPNAPQEGNN